MPSWNELLTDFEKQPAEFLKSNLQKYLNDISSLRENRNVIFYASAFLQKPEAPQGFVQITHEDLNGFMATLYGMQWEKGLTLLLHTPGGLTNAAETVVEYLYQKFQYIEVIIPTFAMSAGTMISLAANKIIMGRQSQLGPIDPQMPLSNRFVSAQSVVDQFEEAKEEILKDPKVAPVWYPILQSIGPALIQEAKNAIGYSQRMVENWMKLRMFKADEHREKKAKQIAKFFRDASVHLSHGRRISREEAKKQGVIVEELENNQNLQEAVLSAYHLITLAFEKSPATKLIESNHDRRWIKNWIPVQIKR
jgi:ClpP class serine protease